MNGATTVNRERGLTTFRLHRIMFMRMMAGPDGAIGSGLAQSPRIFLNIDPSRRPAFLRGLGPKSGTEWKDYSKSGKKPADTPAKPDDGYVEKSSCNPDFQGGASRECNDFLCVLTLAPANFAPVPPSLLFRRWAVWVKKTIRKINAGGG
jgi:hypothetical protein